MIKPEFCEPEEYQSHVNNMSDVPLDVKIAFTRDCISDYCQLGGNICGGTLHIIVDDGNYDDGSIAYCLNSCIKEGDVQGVLLLNLIFNIPGDQRFRLDNEDLKTMHVISKEGFNSQDINKLMINLKE